MMYEFDAEEQTKKCIKWIKDYFSQFDDNTNCCVALSGGKDSTIVATLAVTALGKSRVKGIMLPYHTQEDIDVSIAVAKGLGIEYKIINIGESVDSIEHNMRINMIFPTRVAMVNLPARIRMAELFFYAQCVNGIPSCNCNLSEDWVGYSTYGGDGFGSFAPISTFTVTELRQIGKVLGLPDGWINKIPTDGLCGKSDEDNLGFSYEVLDRYIRTGEIEDQEVKKRIDELHERNLFKLRPMDHYKSGIYTI